MQVLNKWNIGVDVADVSRFRRWSYHKKKNFYHRIFTEKEIKHCLSSKDPAPHFAANYSAKEAVYKAVSGFFDVKLKEIEILRDRQGAPHVNLLNNPEEHKNEAALPLDIKVSLSHSTLHAVAFAVAHYSGEP